MTSTKFNSIAKALLALIPELKPIARWKNHTTWKTLPIEECGEKLVPLGPFSDYPQIFQDAIYAGERTSSPYAQGELKGNLLTPFVREGVAKQLAKAASLLPEGYAIMIWDSYRPLDVQQALFEDYRQKLIDHGTAPEQATIDAQQFVSIPSTDPTRPSPHNTGGAVDLTLVKFPEECWAELKKLEADVKSGDWRVVYAAEMRRQELLREKAQPLKMGTAFDEVSDRTATRYYEEKLANEGLSDEEMECLKNRRLLYNAMRKAGLINYPEEWWHFDSGNQFESIRTGNTAKYGAAPFTKACAHWEKMRKSHYLGTLKMQKSSLEELPAQASIVFQTAFAEARKTTSLQATSHPKASRLEVKLG